MTGGTDWCAGAAGAARVEVLAVVVVVVVEGSQQLLPVE